MKKHLYISNKGFIYFILIHFLLLSACSRDTDILTNSIFQETTSEIIEEQGSEEEEEEEEEETETRSTRFIPTNDAFLQKGTGYDQKLVRLEQDHRTSYLMFDLSPIDSIQGKIKSATLEFTINSDDGDGTVSVFKGITNNWKEDDLSSINTPEMGLELGSISKQFILDSISKIELNTDYISPNISTLILNLNGDNDIAFASKEHKQKIGPKLIVSYETLESSALIQDQTEEEHNAEEKNEAPIAVLDATPLEGKAPLEVTFKGSNSSDDDKIAEYLWNFDNDSTASSINPTQIFTKKGSYNVVLIVTDNDGLFGSDQVTITVTEPENQTPNAIISVDKTDGIAPFEIAFTGDQSTDDNSIFSYYWDFKDDTTSNIANPKHTFTTEGTYDVELTVTDELGLSDTKSIRITITAETNEAPNAFASASTIKGDTPLEVTFTGDQSTDDQSISNYRWDFKDDSTADTANATHIFTTAGTYEVALTVVDASGLSDTESILITVTELSNEAPIANPTANISTGEAPLEISFTGDQSTDDQSISNYLWDFKDGSTADTANTTHTFTTAGIYEVELTVIDASGLSNTKTITITITENQPPNAVASANILSGEAPLEVTFTGDQSTDDHSISSYRWDFKDNSSSIIANPKHTFSTAGTFNVALKVTDSSGLTSSKIITITVTEPENQAPSALAIATPSSGVAPLNIQFVGDRSTDDDTITSFRWDFKDGSFSTLRNPTHTLTEQGSYLVELTVTDNHGLSNTATVTVTVEANTNEAPIAVAHANITTGQAPLEVVFNGQNSTDDTAITRYTWNFKDGVTATNATTTHTFTTAGVYTVDLKVEDADGLSNTNSITINVNPPPPSSEPGYYVTTYGNSSNTGLSEASSWSIEHAINVAQAGDIIHVKAGNYGNKELLTKVDGTSGNPIRFIGYRNTPGDIVSNQGSTFNYGDNLDANNMPLLNGITGQGSAITSYHQYIEFENFQITGYKRGVLNIERATNNIFKNIIMIGIGTQTHAAYDGFGFNMKGNNLLIDNCFVLNASAEALSIVGADYSTVNHTKIYADNYSNPTDYYFLIANGTNNTTIQNSYAERVGYLSHTGHGFDIKDLAEYNTVKNCIAKNTTFELNFSGVRFNTFDGCKLIGTTTSPTEATLFILNGANNNTVKNMTIENTYKAITWRDNDDGFEAADADRDEASMGYDNTFDNITVKNVDRIINVGTATGFHVKASRNTFTNCNFSNFDSVVVSYYITEDIVFRNCNFSNGDKLAVEIQGEFAPYSHFDASWINCNWSNVNFTPPE